VEHRVALCRSTGNRDQRATHQKEIKNIFYSYEKVCKLLFNKLYKVTTANFLCYPIWLEQCHTAGKNNEFKGMLDELLGYYLSAPPTWRRFAAIAAVGGPKMCA
jgi:hypothetical protein